MRHKKEENLLKENCSLLWNKLRYGKISKI